MFSRFFINRPIFATVISIVIVVAGVATVFTLPTAQYPEISPPTIEISAVYPGANAKVISETVASPIEQEVNGVENMLYMSSTCANNGTYTLTVTFEVGTDLDIATVLVQNRVAIAQPKLPEEVNRQGVTTKKKSTNILMMVSLQGDEGEFDGLFLSNYASRNLKDEISRIEGVGDVSIFGAGDYGMRIWLDPAKLKARNLTTNDVVNAIREQNVQVAAGQIGASPAPVGQSFQYTVNTKGRLQDPKEFEKIIIKSEGASRVTRVKDVARVEKGAKSYESDSSLNGKPAALIAVYQLPGANALDVFAQVSKRMEELKKGFPKGLSYRVPFNTTMFVEESIKEVYVTLFQAGLLVFLVIFVFLQDWRATLVPSIAIPVSLIGTFSVMAALGFSINMLTLFGLVLVIGIVVDDSIVVVENTVRHIDESGMSSKDAALLAMEEVSGPVVATTLVLLAVFVPTGFMGGITGQLYQQFSLTIAAATVFSSINALTLSPALCALLLRKSPEKKNAFFRAFNNIFQKTENVYIFFVKGFVRRVALVMVLFFLFVGATAWKFTDLPTGFLPTEDQGYFMVSVQLPNAASLQRTEAVVQKMNKILEESKETEGIKDWISILGFSLFDGTNLSNMATFWIIMDDWDQRETPELKQEAILQKLQKKFRGIQEGIIFGFVPPAIPGLGVSGGFQLQVQDKSGGNLEVLQQMTEGVIEEAKRQSSLAKLNTTFQSDVPQLYVEVDREKIKTLGISLSSVFNTLQSYLGSMYVNDFNEGGKIYQVIVQAESQFRAEAGQIKKLDVRNAKGEMSPLGSFLTVKEIVGPQLITRFNMYPSAAINGEAAPGYSSGEALNLMETISDSVLPETMGIAWTGMAYQQKESGGDAGIIMGLAILLVFLVLAAQYESWSNPIAIIFAVPIALFGTVAGLMVRSMDNNTYTQIGLVLLIALASKNAILIVEFARELRAGGKSVKESAIEAARLRFRPILMTSFSFVLGVFPLVIAAGAGAASRQALGTTVFSGMIAATIMGTLLIPVFYALTQGFSEWLSPVKIEDQDKK